MPIRTGPAKFLTTSENASAWHAVQDLLGALISREPEATVYPLFLYGPSGSGKTRLIRDLAAELILNRLSVCIKSANAFSERDQNRQKLAQRLDAELTEAELLVIEDLQHLPARYSEAIVRILDTRERHKLPTIVTALCGPSQLNANGALPRRLTNRLAGGLVVELRPMRKPSRRQWLAFLADDAQLRISSDILDWLAEHLTGGGRQIEGAIRKMKMLQRMQKKPLQIEDIRIHFQAQIEVGAPTVQRIAKHVGDHYHVKPRRLISEKRSHDVLLPRQVSMYLARQLTVLSLGQIGDYFGGRDHKTVHHACKKVEAALKADRALFSIVRKMRAELA